MPRVDVIGTPEKLTTLAGAGEIVDQSTLTTSQVFTVNEALRKVPGIHARDEEGFGLRPNIAMRGLNPTRSTKITLLEDGIPLTYAPYSDNASYYHPTVDRYERIEVLKGSGALLFGPQTVSGVINYITSASPITPGGYIQGVMGTENYANGKINIGGYGGLLDYTRKQGDGARQNMHHVLDDLNLKYVLAISDNQALTLRANHYQEDSTLTYSGLTQAEYEKLGPRYNPFRNDHFDARRKGVSATHEFTFDDTAVVTTNFYYSYFSRDWWRQASTTSDSQCGAAFTSARLAGVVVDPDTCNSMQGRLRNYTTWGVEPRLTLNHSFGELQMGIKAHWEEQDRRQINTTSPFNKSGTTVENNLRETTAYSAFISNRFDMGTVSITPIVRYEHIEADRTNYLTGQSGSSSVNATSPGIGIVWNPSSEVTLFSSLHKGYAPPRVEDLIGNTGTVIDVNAERSTNFEIGTRIKPSQSTSLQAAYFYDDYQNLVAVGSIAGGSTPLSQGEGLFQGIELSGIADFSNGLFGRFAYTWLPTAEQSEAFRRVDTQAIIPGSAAGLRQPYAPKHTLTLSAGYTRGAFRGELEAQYIGEQYSDFANTLIPTADGQKGLIDGYTVFNATVHYNFTERFNGFVSAKNLADKTYIVDRTRGIQVGMPRLIQMGLRYSF